MCDCSDFYILLFDPFNAREAPAIYRGPDAGNSGIEGAAGTVDSQVEFKGRSTFSAKSLSGILPSANRVAVADALVLATKELASEQEVGLEIDQGGLNKSGLNF